MFTNNPIYKLETRVHELEEIICPISSHEYVPIDSCTTITDPVHMDADCITTMQCKKCKKIITKTEHC